MASLIYNQGKTEQANGGWDWLTDDIKVALVTDGYSPDKDADLDFADISDEVVGAGYTAGGESLASKTVTKDDANDRATYDADDVTWSSATITARAAVVYRDTGTPATSPLIAYIDFGEDFSKVGEDFVIEWASTGILFLGE